MRSTRDCLRWTEILQTESCTGRQFVERSHGNTNGRNLITQRSRLRRLKPRPLFRTRAALERSRIKTWLRLRVSTILRRCSSRVVRRRRLFAVS